MQIEDLADKLNTHLARDSARFEQISKKLDALSGQKDSPQHSTGEKSMSEVRNVFEPGFGANNGNNAGWSAGLGGVIGAAIGNGGLFGGGNREPAVTPDQLQASLNSLQGQMSTDALQSQLGRVQGQIASSSADSTIALGGAIAGLKDSVNHNAAHVNLALCGLGHSIQSGFSAVNQTILMEGARTREQALQTDNANLRAALTTHQNQAGHTATQVLLQQVINSGNA